MAVPSDNPRQSQAQSLIRNFTDNFGSRGCGVLNTLETVIPVTYGIKTEDLNKYITFHRVVNESDMNYLMENL